MGVVRTLPALRRAAPLAIALAALPGALAGQRAAGGGSATLRVTVTAYETGRPLATAAILLDGGRQRGTSDANGQVIVGGIAPGEHLVAIELLGYQTERLRIGFGARADVRADVALLPAPVELPPVEVEARRQDAALKRSGFYSRRRALAGTFITGEPLAHKVERGQGLSDALRGVLGIRVVPRARGSGYIVESTRGRISLTRSCTPAIYVNGMFHDMSSPTEGLDDVVPLADVAAIEVYAGPAEMPYEFQGATGGACGAILIWTKTGT